ncbi:MAG TPA: hypothetical protein VKA84_03315 [Gemmatimonadaceae bacterium]|nr:hypothetical protein [Gemmatimonadaceae bacterium]
MRYVAHFSLGFLALTLATGGCNQRRAATARRREALALEAGRQLAAASAATRAAFRRLPICTPAPPPAGADTTGWVPAGGGRLPPEFRRDTAGVPLYVHGSMHYRAGDRVFRVIGGHFGWASFTGLYAGGGEVPGGCRARVGALEYLVSRRQDAAGHHAAAIPVSDTVEVRGFRLFELSAPEPPLGLLLQILGTLGAPAG